MTASPTNHTQVEPTAWLVKIFSDSGMLLDTRLEFVKPVFGDKRPAEFVPLYETPTPPGTQIRTAECDGKDAVPMTGQLPVGTASTPDANHHVQGRWLPIAQADKTITDVQDFSEVNVTLRMSDRYWVRDDDGRVYEAAWSEGNNGRDFWWDFEGESPVDPVEFMPHPLDPRYATAAEDGR